MKDRKIRLIASDLDGTLLRRDGTISAHTQAALQAARAAGIVVTLATGRMYGTAVPYAEQLQLGDVPLILYNGGLIQNAKSREIIYCKTISSAAAIALLQLVKQEGWQIQAYIKDQVYVPERCAWVKTYEQRTHCRTVVMGSAFYTLKEAPMKFVSRSTYEELERRRKCIEAIFPKQFAFTYSDPTFLEIMPRYVSKGQGLCFLCKQLKILPAEMMVFGDSQNDLSMFSTGAFSVAMGNASAAVKSMAVAVTATNEQDGIADMVERYVLT